MNHKIAKIFPGIFLVAFISIPAWYFGKLFPIIGGPVIGILLGMLFAVWKRPLIFDNGIKYTSKYLLQTAIILLGFEMNLYNVLKVGSQTMLIMLFTLSAAFITGWLVGRSLKLQENTTTLICVGTAICGGSAIAATAPVINADEKEIAYSISTIFLFNIAAVFIFPLIGHIFGMSDTGFGMWAGTAINDTSSVVAAGYSFSDASGSLATIVKLTRTLMIVPITLILSIYTAKKSATNSSFKFTKIFPWFVLGFILTSIISTIGILSVETCKFLVQAGRFLIIMAMTAIGLNTNLKQLIGNGIKPILLGLSCWFAVASVSLIVQYALHLW
ncbi:YeiH family protein [Lutispora sp.]|uniref:YeiH family protein n=1 Tax=Lutispora sp. TaxID=2828727 RepID=UPI002B2057E3|nr:YeiH family protein [Lutispora sp.]MEA4961017.1 YeiH family protein [Lutispora sp.]